VVVVAVVVAVVVVVVAVIVVLDTSCIVFFLEKLFLPMHSGANDIIENLLAKLRI